MVLVIILILWINLNQSPRIFQLQVDILLVNSSYLIPLIHIQEPWILMIH